MKNKINWEHSSENIGLSSNFYLNKIDIDLFNYRFQINNKIEIVIFSVGEKSIWYIAKINNKNEEWVMQCNNKEEAFREAEKQIEYINYNLNFFQKNII